MHKIDKKEMNNITGGASLTASMINAVYKVFDFIYTLGESLGSYIRRKTEDKMCDI